MKMSGRKRKLPKDFLPEPWAEPMSDDDGEWRTVQNLLLINSRRGYSQPSNTTEEETYIYEENPHVVQEVDEEDEQEPENYIEKDEEDEEENEKDKEDEEDEGPVVQEVDEGELSEQAEEIAEERTVVHDAEEGGSLAEQQYDIVEGEAVIEGETYDMEQDTPETIDDNGDDVQSSDDEGDIEAETFESFKSIQEKLLEKWISTEIDHHVSKAASDSFWKVADKFFHRLYQAKEREGISRKVPQFAQARKNMYDNRVPDISMQVTYQHKVTGELTTVNSVDSIPTSQFPPNVYTKICEAASVEVIITYIHKSPDRLCVAAKSKKKHDLQKQLVLAISIVFPPCVSIYRLLSRARAFFLSIPQFFMSDWTEVTYFQT